MISKRLENVANCAYAKSPSLEGSNEGDLPHLGFQRLTCMMSSQGSTIKHALLSTNFCSLHIFLILSARLFLIFLYIKCNASNLHDKYR